MQIVENEKNNLGGIAKLWSIPSNLLFTLEKSSTPGMFKLPIGCLENAYEFWPTFQSASFEEEHSAQPSGDCFNQTVSFTIPKNTFKNLAYLNLLSGRTWGILMLDQNNQYRLAGCRDYPVRLAANTKTGSEISDLNCVILKFTGQSPFRAVFVDKPN